VAKIVRSKRLSRGWKPTSLTVAGVVLIVIAVVVTSLSAGRAVEQRRARDFYYSAPSTAAGCVYQTTSGEFGFSRDFMMCVAYREYVKYRDTPSGVCVRLEERSRTQLWCIIDAESAAEARIQVGDLTRRVEAEQKAAQAKRDAEEKAVAPKVRAAIDKLAPKSDQERRMAALTASCVYAEGETGYRLAYQAYAHASQKGIDAATRFDDGRLAVCNESQVYGR